MRTVKFIKPTMHILPGTITNYQDQYARALVAIGVAEYYTPVESPQTHPQTPPPLENELVEFVENFNKSSVEPVKEQIPQQVSKVQKPKRGRPART
ncbi:hypothetical protein [Klebsiella variicola]|uniref:hypothetical protein n=1 Tax=Klebsiella variicola TaxID=244366 RepID=UPI00109C858A|nr:hypothetical protein [Klebsiella variicola]